MTIQPIPTRYAGCHFRSRLEARWAVFFDTLGIPWEYEPQGFELGPLVRERGAPTFPQDAVHRGYYLPDFWLPDQQAWFEVKGSHPGDEDSERHHRFVALANTALFLMVGGIPDPRKVDIYGPSQDSGLEIEVFFPYGWDEGHAWTQCPWCGAYGLRFEAQGEAIRHHRDSCRPVIYSNEGYNGNAPTILAAYAAARSARFEHGQSGAT